MLEPAPADNRPRRSSGGRLPFAAFVSVTTDVLIDNVRALVEHHDRETREVTFNARFKAFAKHWGWATFRSWASLLVAWSDAKV